MRRLLFECYDRTFEGMTDSEWRVFCAICKHANDDTGGDCFPSTSLLAKESRLHKNTVSPQIKSLEEKKWIRTEQESGKKRYFFVDVGRILSCPRIGVNDSVPLQEPVPLNNSAPLQEPVADGYRKIEGTGTESCTRRKQLRKQLREQNTFSSLPTSGAEDVNVSEPDLFGTPDHTPAAKSAKNGLNPLIPKENMGAAMMGRNHADGDGKNGDNPLNSKEKEDAETPVRTIGPKHEPKKSDRGSRFSLELLPDDWRSECQRIQPSVDPRKVFDDFRDYWIAVPGAKGRKSDWLATWRNWCRRLSERDLQRLALRRTQFSVRPQARSEQPEVKDNPFRVKKPSPSKVDQEEIDARNFFSEVFK